MIWGSGGSKSRLAKAAGAEPAGQMRDEKLHAFVARSTLRSQNVQSTTWSDHFWKLRCRKIARRCGAKHVSKSKYTKHQGFGPLLEVQMSKKCTPLWREAHFEVKIHKTHHVRTTFGIEMSKKCTPLWREARFQVKMYKTLGVGTTFGGSDVEKVHAVVARSTFRSQNVKSTRGSDYFWRFRCHFASLHFTTLHYTSLHYYITLHSTTRYFTLHYTTLHYTSLHYTTLHSTTNTTTTAQLHSTTLHYITLHYTTLHSTTFQYTTLHSTTLHYIE